MKLGEKIAAARRERGSSYKQADLLADLAKLGINRSPGWMASLETGRVSKLGTEYVRALAKILKKPIEYFQDDPPEPSPTAALEGGISYLMAKVLALEQRLEMLERRR